MAGGIIPLRRATSSRFGGRLRQESARLEVVAAGTRRVNPGGSVGIIILIHTKENCDAIGRYRHRARRRDELGVCAAGRGRVRRGCGRGDRGSARDGADHDPCVLRSTCNNDVCGCAGRYGCVPWSCIAIDGRSVGVGRLCCGDAADSDARDGATAATVGAVASGTDNDNSIARGRADVDVGEGGAGVTKVEVLDRRIIGGSEGDSS